MLKFIGLMVVISVSFAGGYYFGQRPVGTLLQTVSDLQHSLKELSRNVLDTTTGIERDLRRRQSLVEAKSELVQARAAILEHNLGSCPPSRSCSPASSRRPASMVTRACGDQRTSSAVPAWGRKPLKASSA